MNYISLFSGAGGADIGFMEEGFSCLLANDINEYACKTYRQNLGDIWEYPISTITESMLSNAKFVGLDVLIGGPPCQSFSNARSGGYDNGYRSCEGLVHIKEYQRVLELTQPKMFIMENAPTLLDDSMINTLVTIMGGFPGYKVRGYKLSASQYGIPQDRERLFFVGMRDDLKYTFKVPKSDHWKNHWGGWADYLGIDGSYILCRRGSSLRGRNSNVASFTVLGTELLAIRDRDQIFKVSGKLLANERNQLGINQRYLSMKEIAKLQAFPDDYVFAGSSKDIMLQVGNAWAVNVSKILAKEVKRCLKNQ